MVSWLRSESPAIAPPSPDPDGSDAELVAQARQGDARAFALLYRRYLDQVYDYCRHRLPSREAADDATQTIFVKALGSIGTCRDGNLYVSEPDIGRVQVFTPEGAFLVAWLGVDDGQGEPFVPLGIAVNGEGVLYVADVVSGTVQRFEVTLPAMPGATLVT